MIDFTKFRFNDRCLIFNEMQKNTDIELLCKYNPLTDEQKDSYFTDIENLRLRITPQSAFLENSLHKYFNMKKGLGCQNFNPFYFSDIQNALNVLQSDLNYPLSDTRMNRLEFGFNLNVECSPTAIIQNCILMHNFKTPCYDPKNDPRKIIKKFIYSEFEIKIYNKTLEGASTADFANQLKGTAILRMEVKYTSRKALNRLGIFTMDDLRRKESYHMLFDDFLKKMDDLLIIDPLSIRQDISLSEKSNIHEKTNHLYWLNKGKIKSRNTVLGHKKLFIEYLSEKDLLNARNMLFSAILRQFNTLMDTN